MIHSNGYRMNSCNNLTKEREVLTVTQARNLFITSDLFLSDKTFFSPSTATVFNNKHIPYVRTTLRLFSSSFISLLKFFALTARLGLLSGKRGD